MLLYICEKCHKWQDVSIVNAFATLFENLGQAVRNAGKNPPVQFTEQIVPCPNGCGKMIQVKPEDKIVLFKEETHGNN
jgi:hypothetical protein